MERIIMRLVDRVLSGNRTSILVAISTLVVVAAATLMVRRANAEPTQNVPFTATLESKFYKPDGSLGRARITEIAVRGNSSRVDRVVEPANDGLDVEYRIVYDPQHNRRVSIEGLTRSVTTYAINDNGKIPLSGYSPTCGAEANAERSSLLGYEVIKIRRDLPRIYEPEVLTTREVWAAPQLNCLPLSESIFVTKNGQTRLATVATITAVTVGEPDPTPFIIPADYKERSPSEVFAERARVANDVIPPQFTSVELEKNYQRHRKVVEGR